tara:strand:+ start:194 stop:1210 length:1017 start_codon:yes stop_codon:yes gene_type:complete
MISDKIFHGALRRIGSRDAETAHNAAVNVMRLVQKSTWMLERISEAYQPHNLVPVEVCGIKFPHRVGAAAGLDKQGQVLPFLQAMGFGFIEVGSVLPRPQLGSPRPRFFLLPGEYAAINRFGFNSFGVKVVAKNIDRIRSTIHIPIGVSLGANKEDVGDDAKVLDGYHAVMMLTSQFASYFALNVSSPNTENLRDLQAVDKIRTMAAGVVEKANSVPVFVKFAPDMRDDELVASAEACLEVGVSGFIATNTTLSREGVFGSKHSGQTGGLSGMPLLNRAVECVRILRSVDREIPIFGVGGVSNFDDASAMFTAGANLVQFYTALFHQGPIALRRISDK